MDIEEGTICEVCGDKAKVKIGRSRIREVKLNPYESYEKGDIVKILMGLVLHKV